MRTNKDFVKRNIGGENILVAVGDASQIFNGMISLNTVASFIWDNVDECGDVDKLVKRVLETFEIDEETARTDVEGFTGEFMQLGMIIES